MLNPTVKITLDTAKLKRLKRELDRCKDAYVEVGIYDKAGEYEDGTSVIMVALWNEFGTESIPSRPFLRNAVLGEAAKINAWRVEVIRKIFHGQMTGRQALEALGFRVRELIRKSIRSDTPPPNAPATLARKRADGVPPRTLVHTQLLLRSVEYRVVGVA